jgi:V8-like Glu-specific endopeptidase
LKLILKPVLCCAPLALLLLTAGCGGPDPEPGLELQPIVNGQQDSGHPQVGHLSSGAETLCTATVIGRRTVLTAAHCVTRTGPNNVAFPVLFTLDSFLSPTTASRVTVHPDYLYDIYGADIAVVELAKPISGVQPADLPDKAPRVGQQVELVGFGITSTDDWKTGGVKRITLNTVASVTQHLVSYNGSTGSVGNICSGDSGGPTFSTVGGKEVLIGVHSTGSRPCGSRGNDVRTDVYRDWIIKTAKGDVGSDVDTFPPSVTITAPSSNSTVSSSFQVKVTATDKVGVNRVELHIDGVKTQTATAPPYEFQLTNVPPGMQFIVALAYDKVGNLGRDTLAVTVVPQTPRLGFGSGCSEDADCKGGLCVDNPRTGNGFCSSACGACPAGYSCQTAGSRRACLPAAQDEGAATGGGCSVSPAAASPAASWPPGVLMLLVVLVLGCGAFRRLVRGAL